MNADRFQAQQTALVQRCDAALARLLGHGDSEYSPVAGPHLSRLFEASAYSLTRGGKRVRPQLVYGAAMVVNPAALEGEAVDYAACAVEMIHAYSLVHDDLPAMDDGDLRRGQPTCHIAFDEATAILVGDGLQARAFELLADAPGAAPETRLAMVRVLAAAAGVRGMVGGQAIDVEAVGKGVQIQRGGEPGNTSQANQAEQAGEAIGQATGQAISQVAGAGAQVRRDGEPGNTSQANQAEPGGEATRGGTNEQISEGTNAGTGEVTSEGTGAPTATGTGTGTDNAGIGADHLEAMHALKTGALVRAAVALGALVAGAEPARPSLRQSSRQSLRQSELDDFARAFGQLFQVCDDVLDATADTAALGKRAGADAAGNKPTAVSVLGLDEARRRTDALLAEALAALDAHGDGAWFLRELTHTVAARVR